jgi:NADPH2:quinone reductase
MHAIRLREFGPPENLRFEELDDLRPGEGEVRIAVAAAGVHLVDTMLRRGEQRGPFPPLPLPTIPGREVAGTVDLVGAGVDPAWRGRRVVVHLGYVPGGYATQALARVASLHALPDGLDERAAVAMIGTGRTAMGILDVAALGSGDVVLVTAAAGGIGSLLVQAARNAGALVVGLAGGPEKVARAAGLGAAVAEDYTLPGWPERVRERLGGRALTVAFDGVGGESGRAALELLGPGGHMVMFGWAPGGEPTRVGTADLYELGITASVAIGPRILRRADGMRGLERRALAAAAAGELRALVDPFPLARAADAHRALEERRTTGKVVLVTDPVAPGRGSVRS